MRVAVFTNLKCYHRNGTYLAEEQNFKFWLALAEHFTHLTLCLPMGESPDLGHFPLEYDPAKVAICHLPTYRSSAELYLKFPGYARKATRKVEPILAGLDLFVAVVPNVIGLHLARLAEKHGIATAFYVRGDVPQSVRFEYATSRWRLFPISLALAIEALAVRRMKRTPTFVVGQQLEAKYRKRGANPVAIITSLIKNEDIISGRVVEDKPIYTLLSIGRLSPEKGVDALLEALFLLKQRPNCPAFRCVIVGDGPETERLLTLTADRGLGQDVEFTGFLPFDAKLTARIQAADVFVNPAYTEGFPKTLLEAMACACPIVCTAVGSIPQVMTHELDALIVPPQDPKALADGLERALRDRNLRQRLLEGGTETVRKFTVERMCDLFMANVQPQGPANGHVQKLTRGKET